MSTNRGVSQDTSGVTKNASGQEEGGWMNSQQEDGRTNSKSDRVDWRTPEREQRQSNHKQRRMTVSEEPAVLEKREGTRRGWTRSEGAGEESDIVHAQ